MPRPSDPNAKIKLLAAAEEEFSAHGEQGAKIERITARAGLSKGAFYLHFASKDDAFAQLVEGVAAHIHAQIDVACDTAEARGWDDPRAYLDRWLDKDVELFEFVWQNRRLMSLLFRGGASDRYRHLVEAFAARAAERSRELFRLGQVRGMYRADLDPELTALVLAGAYDRFGRHVCQLSKKPDFPRLLRQLQSVVVAGIATEELRGHLPVVAAHTDQRVSEPAVAPRPRRRAAAHPRGARG